MIGFNLLEEEYCVMQTLAIAAVVLGLVASVAWSAFLCFELLQLVGLI